MPKLKKRANLYGRTDPVYRKATLLKMFPKTKKIIVEPKSCLRYDSKRRYRFTTATENSCRLFCQEKEDKRQPTAATSSSNRRRSQPTITTIWFRYRRLDCWHPAAHWLWEYFIPLPPCAPTTNTKEDARRNEIIQYSFERVFVCLCVCVCVCVCVC